MTTGLLVVCVCLITFIATFYFTVVWICKNNEIVSKKLIRNSKYLLFDDGIMYKKIEIDEVNNANN